MSTVLLQSYLNLTLRVGTKFNFTCNLGTKYYSTHRARQPHKSDKEDTTTTRHKQPTSLDFLLCVVPGYLRNYGILKYPKVGILHFFFRKEKKDQNLLGIYSSLNNSNLENSINKFSSKNFSEFKQQLSELLINKILPISQEIKKLLQDHNYLDSILLDGVEKANKIASKKIKNIKEIVGF